MASKNISASIIEVWWDGAFWRDSSSESSVWTWDNSYSGGYKVVRVSFPSMEIGSGEITAATLYMKTSDCNYPYAGASMNARLAASNTEEAYRENINSGYISTTKTFSSNTILSFNVINLIPSISDVNSDFYLFFILATGDSNAETEFQRWSGTYSEYQPYLAIEYTPSNSTLGFCTNGSTFTDCEVYYCADGSTFTQCDVYYCNNGSTFTQCSTT